MMTRDYGRENQIRRDKQQGIATTPRRLGRPPSGGMINRYTGTMQDDEWEFAQAMREFQQVVRFPSWSEVLEVIKKLGYKKDG